MKMYLAAPWTRRATARMYAANAFAAGHVITHAWWDHEASEEGDPVKRAEYAWLDYRGVIDCEAFVVLNLEKSEGKAVEQGLALAAYYESARGPAFLIGVGSRGTNIFQNLPVWTWVETFDKALEYLQDRL